MLTADLSTGAAEPVVTAIHALTDPPADGDVRTPARRRSDALVRMAELALAHLSCAEAGSGLRARPSCTVVIDWDTLQGSQVGRLDGDFRGPLHRTEVEKMLCDCSVSRVVTGPTGLPIDAGRTTRTISPQLRRALAARDRGCRFPGCDRPPGWTDVHHVIHWRNGGATNLENCILLCDFHHHLVHGRGWIVKFDGEDARFIGPNGAEINDDG